MQDGENVQALHKQLELIRFFSILILILHFYCACYPAMREWRLSWSLSDKLIFQLLKGFPMLAGINMAKLSALVLLGVSLFGSKGKKNETLTLAPTLFYIFSGLLLYFLSTFFLGLTMEETSLAILYISVTAIGYLSILNGGAKLSRLLFLRLGKDVFNEVAETFPQMEELITNEYSFNFPMQYRLKGRVRRGYVNIINSHRALLICGTPGSPARAIFYFDP
jgi:hypothetical protein